IPVYVAETEEAAHEEPRASTTQSYKRYIDRYSQIKPANGDDWGGQSKGGYEDLLQTRLVYGTPDYVAGRLAQLRDEMGLDGFLIEPNVGGAIPREHVFKSVKLFAEKVAPQLR